MGLLDWWRGVASRTGVQPPATELTDQELDDYLALLRAKGWKVEAARGGAVTLSDSFRKRYPKIPPDYLRFLDKVASCTNADETVWFLCANDYNGTSDAGWAWNEFEKMLLEGSDGEDEAAEITEYWDRHLPFVYSVGGEYAYLAFRMTGERSGSVVDGYELDITGDSEVALNFAQLLRLHRAAVEGRPGNTVLGDYV